MENFGSWSIITTNFLLILFLALGGVTFSALLHLVNGKWRFQVRDLACALWVLFPVAGVLLVILLLGGENTFPWLAHAHDPDHHLSGWHNYTFLVLREVLGFVAIVALYMLFIKYQRLSEIDDSYSAQRRFRNIALLIPFGYFLYGSMVAWDFEMTMIPGWHSASYGAYHFQSNFHFFLAFFTVFVFFLNRSGKLKVPVPYYVYNYMAQFMLGMTILWTYLYFTQYLIMWYGRLPFEMGRYWAMIDGLGPLWWTFLALKFIIPFCTFVFKPNRHNPTVIVAVACSIMLGTWIERYVWISGSVDPQYYHFPMTSPLDIIATAVILTGAWFAVKWSLARKGLTVGS
ncbi:MAG: hypothetical protein GXP10_05470 [Gammaproteobacteria bacterium]|nr:hypothetical protein [Gammaproteobacteria bacterium]